MRSRALCPLSSLSPAAELKLSRYKIIVQTLIGEKRGQGVRFGMRSFWDPNTDFSASASFANESLFASVVAFGVWTM